MLGGRPQVVSLEPDSIPSLLDRHASIPFAFGLSTVRLLAQQPCGARARRR